MQEPTVAKNVALVLQGGGTRGAFTAGVLDVFLENKLSFPYVIGTSAGALNGVNYLSGDIGRSKYVTTELMTDKKFFSYSNLVFRGTAFNFPYLFFTVPKEKCPFNFGNYNGSPVEFLCAATSMKDGKAVYFKKSVCKEFFKALAASSSLPLISRPVKVEGELYLDGGVDASIPFRKPIEDGFTKLVIVETRQLGYRKGKDKKRNAFLAFLMYPKYKLFRKAFKKSNATYNRDVDEIDALEKEGKAFVIRPALPPDVKRTERNQDKLLRLYEQGREVGERALPELLRYIEADHE